MAGSIRVAEMKLTSQTARSTGSPRSVEFNIAGVDPFVHDHARIVAQPPVELAGSHVDGMDARGAGLQQAIGEAAGGGAEIRHDQAGDIDAEMSQRGFQLDAAAADVAQLRGHFDARIRQTPVARPSMPSGRPPEPRPP